MFDKSICEKSCIFQTEGWSQLGSILFPFGPTVHLFVVVLAVLLVRNLAILLD
ncbi:hypothetical protein Tsp_11310, partial [Trichinella spiralis]|uniref:hypothetical protein n=1 Tax=Trichinella spiralis TaxID=6334 RepID=UPI0001EFEF1B